MSKPLLGCTIGMFFHSNKKEQKYRGGVCGPKCSSDAAVLTVLSK
jgi:hypothetical protein